MITNKSKGADKDGNNEPPRHQARGNTGHRLPEAGDREKHSVFPFHLLLFVSLCLGGLCLFPGVAVAGTKTKPAGPVTVPELELEGGRKLRYEGSISSEKEVKTKHSFWGRLLDAVAGEPDFHALITPYSVVTDSQGRIIVTDPGASGIHIFDFTQHKYKFISRQKDNDGLDSPQCVAVDADDNIYVTDSYTGKIFVFDANGKFQRVIGSIKGEGYFKRATGIAVDSQAQRIYVTDTLRNQIWVLDMQGACCAEDRLAAARAMDNSTFPPNCGWTGQDLLRRRRHELPRAGSGSFRKVPIRHRRDGRRFGLDVSTQGNRSGFRGAPLRRRRPERDGAGLRPPGTASLLLRAEGFGVRGISVARRFVYRSQRPRVCGRFLQSSRAGVPVLCVGETMITTKTTQAGRQADGRRRRRKITQLPSCLGFPLPSLCLGVLVVIFWVSPAPRRRRRRRRNRCDRHA